MSHEGETDLSGLVSLARFRNAVVMQLLVKRHKFGLGRDLIEKRKNVMDEKQFAAPDCMAVCVALWRAMHA